MKHSDYNVLVVTQHYLNGVGGGIFASRAFINAFAEIFKGRVTLLCPSHKTTRPEGISPTVNIIEVEDKRPAIQKLIGVFLGVTHRYKSTFQKLIGEKFFDLIVFDNSRCSFGLIDLAHSHGSKVITIHHNYEYEYIRDNAPYLLKGASIYWTRKYESAAFGKSDLNLTLTDEDTRLLEENYKCSRKNPLCNALGAFESEKKNLPIIKERNKQSKTTFIITGNLSATQTIRSLNGWLKQYYPIVRKYFPECEFLIAGKNPSKGFMEKCESIGVTLIPNPNVMESLLEKADFYICPVSLGGGLKLRIMDGLKMGLPVITHSVSARGYSIFCEKGALFAYSSCEEFEEILRSLNSKSFDKKEIQKKYAEVFSFDNGVSRLNEILKAQHIIE